MTNMTLSGGQAVRFELVVSVPWGVAEMPETIIPTPQTSMLTDKAPSIMRAPVRIRVDPWCRIAVLASDPLYSRGPSAVLSRFSTRGDLLASITLGPPDGHQRGWQILDFISDEAGNLYLLETFQDDAGQHNYLRKIAPQGTLLWARSGPVTSTTLDLDALAGTFRQLLVDGQSTPYLGATDHRGMVARIDSHNGTLHAFAECGAVSGQLLMDPTAKIYFVRYLPETRQRCWASYDPHTRSDHFIPCSESVHGFLATPIGVDALGQAYAVMGSSIVCVTSTGALGWQERIDNIVVDPNRPVVYTSALDTAADAPAIKVRAWGDTGELKHAWRLALPPRLVTEGTGAWSLIQVDAAGRHIVHGGETPMHPGTLLIYTSHGHIEEETTPAPDTQAIAYRLQPGSTWSVDLLGRVYLPVAGPTRFHIVRLAHDTRSSE